MKFKLIIFFIILVSCSQNYNQSSSKKPFNSKGFAYIYNEDDFLNKTIKKKFDNNLLQIGHDKLRQGTLIQIINLKTKESIILQNNKKFQFPEFYKILITEPVAKKLNLDTSVPLVEIIEIKKNKSFVAPETKIFKEEKDIPTLQYKPKLIIFQK